jgi:ribonuclease R
MLRSPEHRGTDRPLVPGFTVDGPASRDLDDALWWHDGTLYVTIADVADLVPAGGTIDLEARARVVTRYRREGNEPMLPRRLAEGDLSLLPGRPRPAVTFAIALSTDLQLTSLNIFRSLLENRGRLSYAQADRVIAGSADSPCRGPLLACHELAGRLIARRRDAGALAIYDLRRGWRTTEDGTLVPLTAANSHRSNILIQEAMILANTALAAHAASAGLPILYRNHAASPGDPDRDTALARIQDAVAGRDGGLLAALRGSQPVVYGRARYGTAPEGHHALNLPCYAHWTSPIRRYSDLLNHQVLAAHLDGESPPHDVMALAEIAGRIHEVTDAIRDARIARMKEDHKQEMETLAAGDAPALASLAPDDFFKALGLALAGGLLTPLLVDEVAARAQGDRLGAREIALLLLAPARSEAGQSALLDRALGLALAFLAERRPEHAVSVLNTASQMGGLGTPSFEESGTSSTFRCVARVEVPGTGVSRTGEGSARTKRGAKQMASVRLLAAVAGRSPAPEPAPAPKEASPEPPARVLAPEPGGNPVGSLNEWTMARREPPPSYEFTSLGPHHAPEFRCLARGSGREAFGTGPTKQAAKAEAARTLHALLAGQGPGEGAPRSS